ncbi:hypothetical protein SDC9_118036 [bioreactor metagenome]|uniref:Uncharacterized protein n=1 Tax=bioreactor metagenome TaxID=1076179 RepID=A0A645C6Y3_9ZZZZ
MGNNDDGIFKSVQEVLKPLNSLNIQMVSRLVKEQNVRIAEQSLSQQYAHLLITI